MSLLTVSSVVSNFNYLSFKCLTYLKYDLIIFVSTFFLAALDTALEPFQDKPASERLNATDAKLVDTIHSDAGTTPGKATSMKFSL